MHVNLQYVSKWLVQPGITLMNHSGMFKSSFKAECRYDPVLPGSRYFPYKSLCWIIGLLGENGEWISFYLLQNLYSSRNFLVDRIFMLMAYKCWVPVEGGRSF